MRTSHHRPLVPLTFPGTHESEREGDWWKNLNKLLQTPNQERFYFIPPVSDDQCVLVEVCCGPAEGQPVVSVTAGNLL